MSTAAPFALFATTALCLAQTPAAPTFTEHIAPIVFRSCAGCHRPGDVGPFPLLTYQDVRKRARMIQKVTEERFMPPWHPEPGYGEFLHSLRLADAEVQRIADWVKAGMPEGPKDRLPPLPAFADGWHLGEPDLVVRMPEPFEVPASGRDIYQTFTVPVDLAEDRWITAIEVRPSARAVLHHVLFFVAEPRDTEAAGNDRGRDGGRRRGGGGDAQLFRSPSLGGWAVGGIPERLPGGLAMKLPKHSDITLQSHFHPSGKREKEQTTLALYFQKTPPQRTLVPIQLPPFFGFGSGLKIPAGDKHYLFADAFELPCDVDAFTVGGHAHMLCRSLRMFAEAKDGKKEPLLLITHWDFDWQNRYTFKNAVRLAKGASIKAELTYDNSKDNPNNPNKPPQDVRWGRQTTDEMGSIMLYVAAADEADAQLLQDAVRQHDLQKVVGSERLQQLEERAKAMFADLDKNQDGKVTRDEVPARMRRMFDLLDRNGDGAIDAEEAKNLGGLGGGFGGRDSGGRGGR